MGGEVGAPGLKPGGGGRGNDLGQRKDLRYTENGAAPRGFSCGAAAAWSGGRRVSVGSGGRSWGPTEVRRGG